MQQVTFNFNDRGCGISKSKMMNNEVPLNTHNLEMFGSSVSVYKVSLSL